MIAVLLTFATACSSSSDSEELATTSTAKAETAAPAPLVGADGTFVGVDGVASDVTDSSRIVSLTGDITETIYALGYGDRVVAVDITTTYPPEADQLKADGNNVGFGQALNAESVLRYEPTLVIGDESIQPLETIEQLREAGIPVVIMKYHSKLDGVDQKIREIAAILGDDAAGDELATLVTEEIAEAQARAAEMKATPRIIFLYTRGPSLLFVFGEGIPTNAMIRGAGAFDAGAELGEGSFPLTPEALVAAAPDVIVLPESGVEGLGGIDAVLEIPGVADTPAGRNKALLAYDEAFFFNLGPRAGAALNQFVLDLAALVTG